MLKHIIPRISFSDFPALLWFTFLGALIAGCYGILHDQITFTIGPEYFRNFKFHQFSYADFGLGDRIFAAFIGFLATWWVGLIVGWILARRCIPSQPPNLARQQIYLGFAVVFSTGFLSGLVGYAYGTWRGPNADYTDWQGTLSAYNVTDTFSFMRVAYIHNASYIGGAVGLVLSYFVIRPAKRISEANT
jgi:hypothetical protein